MPALTLGVDYTVATGGVYTFAPEFVGKQVDIKYNTYFSGFWVSALGELGLSLATGAIGQPTWAWLQSYTPAQALAYSGIAYCYASDYPLTNQAELENHSFEIITGHGISAAVPDCWPDVILRDFLVTNSASVGWRAGRLASMQKLKDYVRARQLWLSVSMEEQRPARDWLQALANICNAQWTWQGGLLDLVPRGDENISSAYGTYTPNITPVFDLVYGEGGDLLNPVEITPKVNEDAYNIIKIEWTNRNNNYAIEIMTATDMAHIELFGERPKDVTKMHAIHDANVAQSVAQQLLQREMTVWNEYKFKCPFSRALMGLMDLTTLTDNTSALDRVPVRIIARHEDGNNTYSFNAEDAPIGSAAAPLYGVQGGNGFYHDYNVAPGSVHPPVFFEAPPERTNGALEVYAAVSGQAGAPGVPWGGCSVWVSLDSNNYKNLGRQYGGARYGALTAPMGTTGSAAVVLQGKGGQLLSGTAADAAALSTLCWVDGPQGGEYFAHQTATLNAANAYTLAGLVRGAYDNPVAAHSTGAAFVRLDDAVATSGPLGDELIGKTIYFKFTSFNVYGGAEQSLVDVLPYTYTITAAQLSLPPPTVLGASLTMTTEGVRASWQIFKGDYKDTWLRKGVDWATATQLGASGEIQRASTSYLVGYLPAGVNSVVFKHRDRRDVQSLDAASAAITILAPAPPVFVDVRVELNKVNFQWANAKTSQPILKYGYRIAKITGGSQGPWLDRGGAGSDSRSDNIPFFEAGNWRLEITATDVAGNVGVPNSTIVSIALPDDFRPLLSTVDDFSGVMVNAAKTGLFNRVTLPLNATETYGQHFSTRGWTTWADPVAAGYPLFYQPGVATGSYTKDTDVGAVFSAGTITWQLSINILTGSPQYTQQLGYKRLIGDPWTFGGVGSTSLLASNFRYVRQILTVNSPQGANIAPGFGLAEIELSQLNIGVQTISETVTLACLAGDVNGTLYTTARGFTDVQGVTPAAPEQGSAVARVEHRIVDVNSPGTPAQVFIYLFNAASQRISGSQFITIDGV